MKERIAVLFGLAFLVVSGSALGAGNGLTGEYFDNTGVFGSPVLARTDATVNFEWVRADPGPGVTRDYFSARWTGEVEAPVGGAYQFVTYSNNGIRLWLNNALMIDNWGSHATRMDMSPGVKLAAGEHAKIRIEFFDNAGNAVAKLLWIEPGKTEAAVVPQARLFSTPVTAALSEPVFLSPLKPTFADNGWGVYQRDRSNGEQGSGDGGLISIGGVKYRRGLGVHARSELRYELGGKYGEFLAEVGVDDEVGIRGSVTFEVWLDGVKAFASPVLHGSDQAKPVDLNITGKKELKLIVLDGGDGNGYDHADWASARILAGAGGGGVGITIPDGPTGLMATPGDKQVALAWSAVSGTGITYNVYRGTSANGEAAGAIATGLVTPAFVNTGLINGTTYFYRVAAVSANGTSGKSNEASAKPVAPPPPAAPTGLAAVAGDRQVTLSWNALPGAASYSVYRGTSANGEASGPVMTGLTLMTWTNTGLTNGKTYFFKIAAVNANGTSDKSNEASAKPVAPPPPPAPTGLAAAAGDKQVVLTWGASDGAASYNVYRGTVASKEASTPVITGLMTPTWTNSELANGTTYFFKVAAVSANGTSDRSNEASAMPTAPGLLLTQAQKDAFRFLRQSTFGPTQALMDHVVDVGKATFLDEQFALPPTPYPDVLITKPNMELVSEQFFQNAMTGQDQLRQRVAWALSQIFVTSAAKVDNTHAMVPYIRMLEARAFDNVKDIMRDVSLSPAMGEFLDLVDNKKANLETGVLPNENYAREWMQLFAIGLVELNDDGTPMPGNPVTYTQADIADMARALTGWTYGDKVAGNPTKTNKAFYDGPMEPVDRYHDTGQKTILGENFPAGQSTQEDFDHALSVVFNHHNVGPFLVRQLIQKLVSSNPSPAYIRDVVGVFNNNGQGVRGDLKAVVRAILLHPEASSPAAVKFPEPALFLTTVCRVLCGNIVDHPFMSDFSESMSQRIWFAPSVFNYYSPNYRAGNIFAPELQIWTTATAMTRANWVASLVSGGFGSDVTLNLGPFNAVAADPNALLDTVNSLLAGGTMPSDARAAILQALASSRSNKERVQTAIYLTAASMQYQVEH